MNKRQKKKQITCKYKGLTLIQPTPNELYIYCGDEYIASAYVPRKLTKHEMRLVANICTKVGRRK